jgi:hypothetical protein
VPGVAAVHYPPGGVDPSPATFICPFTSTDAADRSAVNSHAELQARMLFKRAIYLKCTLRRFLGLL